MGSKAVTIVVAPDSFKGSLSSTQVAEAMRLGLLRALPTATIHSWRAANDLGAECGR
jgi:glycerate kinase